MRPQVQLTTAVKSLLGAIEALYKYSKAAKGSLPAKVVDRLVEQHGWYGKQALGLLCARRVLPADTAESSARGLLTIVYESCCSWEKGGDGKYHESRRVILPEVSVVKCLHDTISEGGSDGITVEFAVMAVTALADLQSDTLVHQALAMLFALDYIHFTGDSVFNLRFADGGIVGR